jgi:hypothetical protein
VIEVKVETLTAMVVSVEIKDVVAVDTGIETALWVTVVVFSALTAAEVELSAGNAVVVGC